MRNKLIVALDVNSFDKAKKLIDKLSPYVNIFKVGSQLFTTCGPKIINYINKESDRRKSRAKSRGDRRKSRAKSREKKAFLDLKFFDIPNTVEKAILAAAKHKVFMVTLHITGGFDMLKKAANVLKGKKRRPLLVGVTVLTSKAGKNIAKEVTKLALIAKKAKLDGIVCSAKETKRVKKACGKKFIVVNPGIRPLWAAGGDQKRINTPEKAIENGADFIVVGRPITKAKDPVSAAKKILEGLK